MSDSELSSLIEQYQLQLRDLRRQASDILLIELALSHCQKWKFLASHLGMETIVVQDIEAERMLEEDKRRSFFLKWKELKGSDATYRRLIVALLKIRCRDDAESVCRLVKEHGPGGTFRRRPESSEKLYCNRSLCLGIFCCFLAFIVGIYVVHGSSWTPNLLSEYTGGILKRGEPDLVKPSTDAETDLPTLSGAIKDQKGSKPAVKASVQPKTSRLSLPDPSNCHTTGRGMKVAMVGEKTTALLQAFNLEGKPCKEVVKSLQCSIISRVTRTSVSCSVERREQNQYQISYQPVSKGEHILSITIGTRHVRSSPFSVAVKAPIERLGTPIQTIYHVKNPWGVIVKLNGEIVISETEGHLISVYSPSGEKLRTFGTRGSGQGQFENPSGLAVDEQGNILVADFNNHRIQKFTAEGHFLAAVGSEGSGPLQFGRPSDIVSCNDKVYVLDWSNNHVQVLNYDLTFSRIFGSKGSGQGQFSSPRGIACDSSGKLYVADSENHRIQVFKHNGGFLRMFGAHGKGRGELDHPVSIAVDSDMMVHVSELFNYRVSVFTSEGQFVVSFGSRGTEAGELNFPVGIAVDGSGAVYVCDWDNNRLQIF